MTSLDTSQAAVGCATGCQAGWTRQGGLCVPRGGQLEGDTGAKTGRQGNEPCRFQEKVPAEGTA